MESVTLGLEKPRRTTARLRTAALAGVASAQPPLSMSQDEVWETFFAAEYAGNRLARRIWERSGVERRFGVARPDEVRTWSTAQRMERFVEAAVPLGADVLRGAVAAAAIDPAEVGLLVVASSTGYSAPGLDVLLARELGLRGDVERLHLGHMGCHAALVALTAAADTAAARGVAALVLALELTTLHAQPPSDEVEAVVANALFSDGAAAAALVPGGTGLELVDVAVANDVESAELVRWEITDLGFKMALSPRLPALVEARTGPLVRQLLERHDLSVADVAGWAVHPGGPRILEAVAASLGLRDDELADAAATLRERGHCSSATVLMVLERVLGSRPPGDGDHLVALAVGPGLTVYASLFRAAVG